MEQEEPQDVLYDFLYRDLGRLSSYYSPLFAGRLTSLEETDTDRDGRITNAAVNIQIAKGELGKTEETSTSSKRTIDPHDLIATDVLTSLQNGSFIRTDIIDAPHGTLVQAQGTIVFADKHMLDLASVVFKTALAAEKQKPRNKQNQEMISGYQMLDGFLEKIPLPSAFIIETTAGVQIAGTIKDEGMEEPISTYYFRHGVHGLADIYAVGIKEIPSATVTLPATPFLEASKQTAQGLTTLLIPPDAVRITPLAFFRKLSPTAN